MSAEKLTIDLIGEACVPEVTITEPICGVGGGLNDGPIVRFHRTLVEETSVEKFSFENVGFVEANVIVEIYENPNGIFGFSATTDTRTLLRTTDYEDDGKRKKKKKKEKYDNDVPKFLTVSTVQKFETNDASSQPLYVLCHGTSPISKLRSHPNT